MNDAARFALRVLRLGADTTAAVASNLAASAIETGNAQVASVCLAIAATFTAVKGTAEHYLGDADKQEAQDALKALVDQHGDLRKALQAIAAGQGPQVILSEVRAQELLGLIDRDPDDPAELALEQNEILFHIVRWLEKWQAQHVAEGQALSHIIATHFGEQVRSLARMEAKGDAAANANSAAHTVTHSKLDLLPELLSERLLAPSRGNDSISDNALSGYLSWITATTATFAIPGMGVALPIMSAWAELKVIESISKTPTEGRTLEAEVARYHEWERLSSSRDFDKTDAEHIAAFNRLVVVIAGPGAGKSTLLRRLAHRFAEAQQIVVHIRLSLVAQRIQAKGEAFEDAIAAVSSENSPLDAAAARQLLRRTDYLLADGLDECDPMRARIAQLLVTWAASHPDAHVVVATRPVGHDPGWLPGWQHTELLPLDPSSIRQYAGELLKARFVQDAVRAYDEEHKFNERIKSNAVASLAARNPLLLGFLIRLSLDGVDYAGYRASLYGQIVDLMLHTDLPDRHPAPRVDDSVAWRCLELIGWMAHSAPGLLKGDLLDAVALALVTDLHESRVRARATADQATQLWEAQHVLETLRSGGRQTVTFVHMALQEYAAARHAASQSRNDLRAWVERVWQTPRYREVLLLAAGCGGGDTITRILLDLDEPEDPISHTAILAAASLGEYCADSPQLQHRVAEHLMQRLTSDIPLIVYEAALSLLGLAAQMPGIVGPLVKRLSGDVRPWVRIGAVAVGVHAGRDYVQLSELQDVYRAIGGTLRRRASHAPWDLHTGGHWQLEKAMMGPATTMLLEALPNSEGIALVEQKLQNSDISVGSADEIVKVLRRTGHIDVIDRYHQKFAAMFGKLDWQVKRESRADETLFRAVVAATGLETQDVAEVGKKTFTSLGAILAAISLWEAPISDFFALADDEVDEPMVTVLKGVIASLRLSLGEVGIEARTALVGLAQGESLFSFLPQVRVKPKWEEATNVPLNVEMLASALDHRSRLIALAAANLLEAGVGGARSADAVRSRLEIYGRHGLWAVSLIAERLWKDNAIYVLLNRLESGLTEGCEHLLVALSKLSGDGQGDRVTSVLVRALHSGSEELATGAAKALLNRDFTDIAEIELRRGLAYWKENEAAYPIGGGIVPHSPRADIIKTLVAWRRLSLSDLISLSRDVRSDVRDTAMSGIIAAIERKTATVHEVLRAIERGELVLAMLSQLAVSPNDILAAATEQVLDFLKAESPDKRVATVAALAHPWIDSQRATDVASACLTDPDPSVRDQAVRTLRLLREQKLDRPKRTR